MSARPRSESVTITVNAADPTESLSLRDSFQSDLYKRWRDVRGKNRTRLEQQADITRSGFTLTHRNFIESLVRTTVVEATAPRQVLNGKHWSATRIRTAYDKGLRLARNDLQALNIDPRTVNTATRRLANEHQTALEKEYEQVYATLTSHIQVAADTVADTVRRAIQGNESTTWLVENANSEIRDTMSNRYTALANTAIVRAVNTALLTSFELADLSAVAVATERRDDQRTNYTVTCNAAGEVRYTTASDADVCSECRTLAGEVFGISDVQSSPSLNPPIHPNCRCRLLGTPI